MTEATKSGTGIVLDVRSLSKRFPADGVLGKRQVHAVEDVSFTMSRKQIVAMVGESGSGKSTTARMLARLIEPTAGEMFYNGEDVLRTESKRASLAYRGAVQMVFQDPFASLNPAHRVEYLLKRPLKIHNKTRGRRETRERIEALLEAVGLASPGEVAASFPHELSGGQRQRVAFARALAVEPRVMLADEPVSMLDVSIRIGVLNLMRRLADDQGLAFLYITHDIASARYISDHMNVMYAGRMVEGAPTDALVREPAHPYTKLLLSAVPDPHAGLIAREVPPRGEIPSLIDPPPGCPFAARCPYVMRVCREAMPPPVTVAPDHWVRCYLHGGEPVAK